MNDFMNYLIETRKKSYVTFLFIKFQISITILIYFLKKNFNLPKIDLNIYFIFFEIY